MALALSKEKLAEITGGRTVAGAERVSFHGVEFDSREIKGGELFVAMKGEKIHGEKFLDVAFGRGAAAALVESGELLDSFPQRDRLVVVPDALKAFWALAARWRQELKIPVVAVTGSVGKTTTKEILASVLLKHGRGTYSLKSHNNHVGVPYTICRIPRDHEWAVLEMGMNHAGELSALTAIARPDVAAITKLAPAHIEYLGSMEAIARAKLEIAEGLPPGGTLILPAGDAVLEGELARMPGRDKLKIRYFGAAEGCDARLAAVKGRGLDGISFGLELEGERAEVLMSAIGEHNAANAACAALAARTSFPAMPLADIVRGLADFRAPLMRLNIQELGGGRKVVDDSYNANPASMSALVELAGELKLQGAKIALIVGDMLELGEHAERYHLELGEKIAALGPRFVIAAGKYREALTARAKERGIGVMLADSPTAAGHIATKVDFDILLVKASRGVGLEKAVEIVVAHARAR